MFAKYEDIDNPQLIKVQEQEIRVMVDSHVSAANLLIPPLRLPAQADRVYTSNSGFWKAILEERLRAALTVTLQNFLLFDWLPRAPGLFHTEEAAWARREALNFLAPSAGQAPPGIGDAGNRPDYMFIFDPYGKINMIKGGIGCIRLQCKSIESGTVWFMSASSTPTAHEGIPIALPEHLHEQYVARVESHGVVKCTLTGKLKFLPEAVVWMFSRYADVPQLYLLVEDVSFSDSPLDPAIHPRVSIAVSFQSAYEGYPRMYASYVTFYPGQAGSFRNRVEWLDETYVKGMYQGRIVTNFDEHRTHYGVAFDNAILDIEKVMNNRLSMNDIAAWRDALHLGHDLSVFQEGLQQADDRRSEQVSRRNLILHNLVNLFSSEELATLCFELGVDSEMLAGEGKEARARELIQYLERRARLQELIDRGRAIRPLAEW